MTAWYHDGETDYVGDTVAYAEGEARSSIDGWLEDGEWADEYAEAVAWGLVVQQAVQVDTGPACPDCGAKPGPHWSDDCSEPEPTCDYELRDAPDLAASIVEVLRSRPEATQSVICEIGPTAKVAGPWAPSDLLEPEYWARHSLAGPVGSCHATTGHGQWAWWTPRASGDATDPVDAMEQADRALKRTGYALIGGTP